jgi:hypothetical protein
MAVYITASGSQTVASQANGVLIQLNKALVAETIAVAAGGTTIATITGAAGAGSQFRYGGLSTKGAITVNPSGAVDITVSLLNKTV